MNLCLFFEGTGQGVAGKITNVSRLRDLCVAFSHNMLKAVGDEESDGRQRNGR